MKEGKWEVDKELFIDVNGDRQNIRIRAAKQGLTPILFVHGGPGVCDRHLVLKNQSALAENYTLVCWDQRGSGKSYTPQIKEQKLTLRTYLDDVRAVIDKVCEPTGSQKLVLAGHSWGSVLGLITAKEYPQKIAAYIGQGQFIDGWKNEEISYAFCVEEAKKRGNKKALKQLEGGAPSEGRYPSDKAMMTQRDWLSKFGGGTWKKQQGLIGSLLLPLLKSPEYSLAEIGKYASGALYLSKALWNDVVSQHLGGIEELDMPVIITQGDHDFNTPTVLAKEWFEKLNAPYKKWISFAESAHSPIFEEPQKWGEEVKNALNEALKI